MACYQYPTSWFIGSFSVANTQLGWYPAMECYQHLSGLDTSSYHVSSHQVGWLPSVVCCKYLTRLVTGSEMFPRRKPGWSKWLSIQEQDNLNKNGNFTHVFQNRHHFGWYFKIAICQIIFEADNITIKWLIDMSKCWKFVSLSIFKKEANGWNFWMCMNIRKTCLLHKRNIFWTEPFMYNNSYPR